MSKSVVLRKRFTVRPLHPTPTFVLLLARNCSSCDVRDGPALKKNDFRLNEATEGYLSTSSLSKRNREIMRWGRPAEEGPMIWIMKGVSKMKPILLTCEIYKMLAIGASSQSTRRTNQCQSEAPQRIRGLRVKRAFGARQHRGGFLRSKVFMPAPREHRRTGTSKR